MSEVEPIVSIGIWLSFAPMLLALFAWLVFLRQRDVLETAETASRILVGTLLVLLQLAYYTAFGLTILLPCLVSILHGNGSWILLALTVAYMSPIVASMIGLAFCSQVLSRRWRLCSVEADHPVRHTITELSAKLGLRRPVKVCWAATLIPSPFVIQPVFRSATLVLPLDWELWGRRCAQDEQTARAVSHFVLLHELSHVRNGDVFFITWAGMFLWSCRLWVPIMLAIQLVLLFVGVYEWFEALLGFSMVATMVVYLTFRLLYLSVARQRELLADARALLYTGEEQVSLLLHRSTIFIETARLQEGDKRWRSARRLIAEGARLLITGWEPLAVLPVFATEGQSGISFLRTHPSGRMRRLALQERSAIHNQVGSLSQSAACWVGVIMGVVTAFLSLPFTYWVVIPTNDLAREALFVWSEILKALYPALALCLPLRNALSYFQPLGAQVRQFLQRFGQAGLCYLGVCLLGYANGQLIYWLAGWTWESSLAEYAEEITFTMFLSLLIAASLLAFMRYLSHLWGQESKPDIVWALSGAVILVSALIFLTTQIDLGSARPLSYDILSLMGSAMAVAVASFTIDRLVTATIDFQKRNIVVYWGGSRPGVWRKEYNTAREHLFWAGLTTVAIVGVVAIVPACLTKLAFEVIYCTVPLDAEDPWVELVLFALLVVVALLAFEQGGRIALKQARGINKREAFLRDARWLVEIESAFDTGLAHVPQAVGHYLPAGLLADFIDAPSVPWWIPATTLDTIARASCLARRCFGPKALSSTVAEHVKRCSCSSGGFGFWPNVFPRIGATYYALYILDMAAAVDQIDRDAHARWIAAHMDAEGRFCFAEHGCPSLQGTVDAIQSLALLGRLELADGAQCAQWVERMWLCSDRSLDQTRCAVTSLALLDALMPDFIGLLESSWLPRYRSLILSLRVDKQIGHVWDYVQIVSHLFAPSSAAFATWTDGLSTNVLEGWHAFFSSAS